MESRYYKDDLKDMILDMAHKELGNLLSQKGAQKYFEGNIDKVINNYIKKISDDSKVNRTYLKVLKNKGVVRKGKLEFVEKNKSDKKVIILELTEELENELDGYVNEIQELIASDKPPEILNSSKCKKCAYYEYCYI